MRGRKEKDRETYRERMRQRWRERLRGTKRETYREGAWISFSTPLFLSVIFFIRPRAQALTIGVENISTGNGALKGKRSAPQ